MPAGVAARRSALAFERGCRLARGGTILIAVTAVALLGGCRARTESDRVSTTIRVFFAALARGDGATACRQLTAGQAEELVRRTVAGDHARRATTCPAVIAAQSAVLDGEQRSAYRNVPVVNVTIAGDRAQADLSGLAASLDLTRSGGRWRIAAGLHA
jgi:hypothetical protein